MDIVITVLAFGFVLGVLVFIHELGHFLVAKRAGIRVERFSLGYPPKMLGITFGETEYCISWVPLGGYVKLAGMADIGVEEVKGEPWEFMSKPVWIRMCVMAAGPFMNFLLGFLILFAILALFGGMNIRTTRIGWIEPGSVYDAAGLRSGDRLLSVGNKKVSVWEEVDDALTKAWGRDVSVDISREDRIFTLQIRLRGERRASDLLYFLPSEIGSVLEGHPADRAGLKVGDRIVAINGQEVSQWWDVSKRIHALPDMTVRVDWIREGRPMSADIRTDLYKEGGASQGRIGISSPMPPTERVPMGLGAAAVRGARETYQLSGLIFRFVGRLISGRESGQSLAGPLTIASIAGKSVRLGAEAFLGFMALLSINLAVLNMLPIPVLDGGHLIVMALEWLLHLVTRRPFTFTLKQKETLQQFGLVILSGLMIYVFYNDILRLIRG